MSDFDSKTLWAVSMDAAGEALLMRHAIAAKATIVCVRSNNARLLGAIDRFHAAGIKVYAWRWPAAVRVASSTHYFATDEAAFVVDHLIPNGLDGYVADPESDHAGDIIDWNHLALAPLARSFCRSILAGAAAAGRADFVFGVTSGCGYPLTKPNIPWSEFVKVSGLLLPQTYWRWTNNDGHVQGINGGTPDAAIDKGASAWSGISGDKLVIPMAGEIDVATAPEIAAYGARLRALGLRQAHFYADGDGVPESVLSAIADL